MSVRDPAGFTLIEVMVALVVGGMAVAAAAALLSGLGDRAAAVERVAERVDRDANGERLLRSLLANLALSPDTAVHSLTGDATSARFGAWCDAPEGWLERCAVRLFFEQPGGVPSLRLALTGAVPTTMELRRGFRAGGLRYLVDAEHGGRWASTWTHIVPPLAVAVIMDRDTLLLPVWGSG